MAVFNGNSPYMTLGGVSFATPFISVQPQWKNKTQIVTAGAGITGEQRASGLDDASFKVDIGYIVGATLTADLPVIKTGTVEVFEWGPESNVAGKPRHTQSVIVADVSTKQDVDKTKVVFTVTLEQADVPTNNMYAGATY